MEQEYSNREIDRMFGEIIQTLNRIETAVNKTNGRVTALEHWKESFVAKVSGIMITIVVVWNVGKEFIKNLALK